MPAETTLPGLPNELLGPMATVGEAMLVVVVSMVLGRVVRSGLTHAGLQPPTEARPGFDWARIAGLLSGVMVFVLMLPALFDGASTASLRAATSRMAEAVYPLLGCLLALGVGDHHRRVLLVQADKTRDPSVRQALSRRSEQVHLAAMVVAGLALVGQGLWAAWPLGVAVALVWALRDDRVRPVLDRWAADWSAGHKLRKAHSLREGTTVALLAGPGVLRGPVGPMDTRVGFGEEVVLMRNTDILNELGPPVVPELPEAEPLER